MSLQRFATSHSDQTRSFGGVAECPVCPKADVDPRSRDVVKVPTPDSCCAAKRCARLHGYSITSSARESSIGGIFGCSTGDRQIGGLGPLENAACVDPRCDLLNQWWLRSSSGRQPGRTREASRPRVSLEPNRAFRHSAAEGP